MTSKEALHRLIDELPENELYAAQRFLEYLRATSHDPLLRAFMEADEDDEPLTPEDIAAIEEGRAEIARGEGIPWEVARAQLLSDD